MFERGLVIGKFYPPHRGHKFLIDTARAQCRQVTVIVCWKCDQNISGALRAAWLRRIHPDVTVIATSYGELADDDSRGWADHTRKLLGYAPDAVFTSESYGDAYAAFMGSTHVLVDRDRRQVPVSATLVRGNPRKYAAFLEPCVRGHFAQRIAVVGAESTGTTTLSRALAAHYRTVWVPEYGRFYAEGKQHGGLEAAWRTEEFVAIAQAQAQLEDTLAESSSGLLICDTNAWATAIWHERYMGFRSEAVEAIGHRRKYALTIVTGDDIPFVQDGLRDGEHLRHGMHKRFVERLKEDRLPTLLVTGGEEERLARAIAAIEAVAEPDYAGAPAFTSL